ncbi:hypothetical protein ACHAW5_006233 [Stephanodiscus triporus]|uniref:Cytochrome b5 heme-binding domain-containing protein n=1 Tax=Stephanodiscus triporus TaxID=2934178 RepID=A0ABD3PCB6_9STRA
MADHHRLPSHYTHDGSLNHPSHPLRGASGTPRIRSHPPLHSYRRPTPEDDPLYNGTALGGGGGRDPLWRHPRLDLPSARNVLVSLFRNVPPRENEGHSQLLMAFGHCLTRDITRTTLPKEDGNGDDDERDAGAMPIECDGIETRGPYCPEGRKYMEFHRAPRSTAADDDDDDTGEPINSATTWMDMDHIYGNAPPTSPDYLRHRTGAGGTMRLDERTGLPPIDDATGLYSVYDDRVRQLPMDLAIVSTFLKYHNKRAAHHGGLNPGWDDETLFHLARMDVLAVYQNIFEMDYVPAVLGKPLKEYRGYDPSVDASIDVFFSTCSFRYGHSGLSGLVRLLDKNWEPLPQDPMLMRDVYNGTEQFVRTLDDYLRRRCCDGGEGMNGTDHPGRSFSPAITAVIRGLTHDATRAADASFVDDMSLFMAGSVAKNVQRGRDNGLPSYNEARVWFGLEPARSYLDLANGDMSVARTLEELYGPGRVDDVDAYVGAMLETPASEDDILGPLNIASMRDQWERLRDGDRLYYRARLTAEEIRNLPTLADLMRDAWGEDEMRHFPDEIFAIVSAGGNNGRDEVFNAGGATGMELFDGDLNIHWQVHDGGEHIDFTLSTPDIKVSGGYVGLGWNSNIMKGAEVWFCVSSESDDDGGDETCDVDEIPPETPSSDPGPFSCCVVDGDRHVALDCDGITRENYLTVLKSCASAKRSYVTVRARLCQSPSSGKEETKRDCFSHEGDLQFIAAYNPDGVNVAHGFSRRKAGSTNLAIGYAATCSDDSNNAGLFALHGALLLTAWLILAPIAIYVVRYYKGKSWRLKVHISLVGVIISLMFALVMTAIISVEGTSFGTVDARSATLSKHKIIGLSVMCLIAFMVVTGELRRKRTLMKRTESIALERAVIISHRCGGFFLVGAAWYNCYTGLIQIGPYEQDSVEITFFSSKTVSLGYDLELFGFFRKYLFFPWLGIVIVIFLVTEVRVRLANKMHAMAMSGTGDILAFDNDKGLPEMSLESFLFMTRHGSELAIIDGYVVDIGAFIEHHPGGSNVLKFAVGSDITPYFIGARKINGQRHTHSSNALRALQPLVKWKLEGESKQNSNGRRPSLARKRSSIFRSRRSTRDPSVKSYMTGRVFRSAMIVGHEEVSVGDASNDEKRIIKLSVSVERDEGVDILLGTPIPTSTFIIRHVDSDGIIIERPYTAVGCHKSMRYVSHTQSKYFSRKRSQMKMSPSMTSENSLPLHTQKTKEEIVYEFFISLVPGGGMSTALERKKIGKRIMILGPMADKPFLMKLNQQPWADVCVISQGSGITAGLQLIDYFLQMKEPPRISLLWWLKARHKAFEIILKFADREQASSNFQYLITNEETSKKYCASTGEDGPLIGVDEKDALLQLCQSKGIRHPETVDALLLWAQSKGDNKSCKKKDIDDKSEDCTLINLSRIGESLRAWLLLGDKMHDCKSGRCFRGCDVVSFILSEDYTPSRESAIALGREMAKKLKLFEHVTDAPKLLLDNADEYYMFCDDTPYVNCAEVSRTSSSHHHLDLTQGMLLAVCGYTKFEYDMIDLLKAAGAGDNQLFRFPEGSTPLSALSAFIPDKSITSSRSFITRSNQDDDESNKIRFRLTSKTSHISNVTSINPDEPDASKYTNAPTNNASLDASLQVIPIEQQCITDKSRIPNSAPSNDTSPDNSDRTSATSHIALSNNP